MCTFVILGSAQSSVQGGIVFVLGKAHSGLISLLGALLLLCVCTVFGTVVFILNIWLWLCV